MAELGYKSDKGTDYGAAPDAFALVPDGWYTATVEGAKVEDIRNNGKWVSIQFRIFGDKGANRVVFDRYITKHEKESVQDRGRRDLQTLHLAGGVESITDTRDLIGLKVEIEVGSEKASGDWPAKNKVWMTRAIGSDGSTPIGKAPAKRTPVDNHDDIPF
ncbi:MAG: hypothetical protein ACI9MR_000044 [Myxococcota bacterium]|jgi:hypothetical protein